MQRGLELEELLKRVDETCTYVSRMGVVEDYGEVTRSDVESLAFGAFCMGQYVRALALEPTRLAPRPIEAAARILSCAMDALPEFRASLKEQFGTGAIDAAVVLSAGEGDR